MTSSADRLETFLQTWDLLKLFLPSQDLITNFIPQNTSTSLENYLNSLISLFYDCFAQAFCWYVYGSLQFVLLELSWLVREPTSKARHLLVYLLMSHDRRRSFSLPYQVHSR